MSYGIDICGVCRKSALVQQGRVRTPPNDDPETNKQFPTLWEFTCKACLKPKLRLVVLNV